MGLRLAISGATGLVGRRLLAIIEAQQPPLGDLGLYASAASAGGTLEVAGRRLPVADLAACDFSAYDAAFFCVGDALSAQFVPRARAAGCAVVDKSNTYRLDPQVPLVVPRVNDEAVQPGSALVANPNCTTIVLCHALGPLMRRFGLRRLFCATYQSVSGAGRHGVSDLLAELRQLDLASETLPPAGATPAQLASNVHAGIGAPDGQGRCSEEAKLVEETRKILGAPGLAVAAHAVRVPVLIGHAVAVTVELERAAEPEELRAAWIEAPDVRWMEDQRPTPLGSALHEQVEVGRLRPAPGLEHGYSFFACGDNLHLGAALNGWRILELMQRAGAVPPFAAQPGGQDG